MSTLAAELMLRAGTAADVGVVEELMADAFDPRFGEAWTRGQCLGVMGLPGVWLVIAAVGQTPAGFALARATMDEGELLLLATAVPFRRRGVAAALLRETLAGCRTRGLAELHLEVRRGNGAAELYRRAGFAKVGERRGYYRGKAGESFDAHTFSRAVGAGDPAA